MSANVIYSVCELIRDVGERTNLRCSLCGRWSVYQIGTPAAGFTACLMCDTNSEARKAANLKSEA